MKRFLIIVTLFVLIIATLFTIFVMKDAIEGKGIVCSINKENETNNSYPIFGEEHFFFVEKGMVQFNSICKDFGNKINRELCIGQFDIAKYSKKDGRYVWSNSNEHKFSLSLNEENLIIANKENDRKLQYNCEIFDGREKYTERLGVVINKNWKEYLNNRLQSPKSK